MVDNKAIILNRVKEGTVSEEMHKYFSNEEDVIKLLNFLESDKNKRILHKDEKFNKIMNLPSLPPGTMAFMLPETNYFIDVRLSTIMLIAFILDLSLTKGAFSFLTAALGMSGQSVVKLTEEEKCFVVEMSAKPNRKVDVEHYTRLNECVNKHFKCKYNNEGCCCMLKDESTEVFEKLKAIKIIKNDNDGPAIVL